ncbi:hypothetical protein AB0D04_24685 [Streptomyces sp. NPDC048483]|uniref:hypothetical protein n=1 Tax=Streptomyces sp. NPDC048483 TaxID=3154927 RepID=UPI00344658A3
MAWRGTATAAAWIGVLAAAGGLGAWTLAHTDTGSEGRHARADPLDDAAVRERLAQARSAAEPTVPPPPSPSATTAPARTVRVTGGSLTAVCRPDGRVYLTAWSPDAGFHVDEDVARGPAAVAALEFEPSDDEAGADDGAADEDLPYTIRCADGRPKATPAADHDEGDD